jgi:hypothetical protein
VDAGPAGARQPGDAGAALRVERVGGVQEPLHDGAERLAEGRPHSHASGSMPASRSQPSGR